VGSAQLERGKTPWVLAVDNGGAQKSAELRAWARETDVILLFNVPRTPQHNAWVERGFGELRVKRASASVSRRCGRCPSRCRVRSARACRGRNSCMNATSGCKAHGTCSTKRCADRNWEAAPRPGLTELASQRRIENVVLDFMETVAQRSRGRCKDSREPARAAVPNAKRSGALSRRTAWLHVLEAEGRYSPRKRQEFREHHTREICH
jgi:hypothetical protein